MDDAAKCATLLSEATKSAPLRSIQEWRMFSISICFMQGPEIHIGRDPRSIYDEIMGAACTLRKSSVVKKVIFHLL